MRIDKDFSLRLLCMYVFMLWGLNANGQQWLSDFKHFTPLDGLPGSEVYQITSDVQKNIWFATDRGAVRYDGYSFRTFDTKDSLPDNSVIKLYKDRKGRIWFISYTCLLSYFENGKIVPFKYNKLISAHLNNSIITSLYVDESENVFINTIEGVLYTITASGNFIKKINNSKTNLYVIGSAKTPSVTTTYYGGKNREIAEIKIEGLRDTFSFTINDKILYSHFASIKLRNNDLIFYCERFLIRIHPSGKYEVKKIDAPILNVFEDDDKTIWVGTYHNGFYVFDSDLNKSANYLRGITISHIYKDFEGGYWLSSLDNGIYYRSSKNIASFAIDQNQLHDKITDVCNISDSVLFFTTARGELFKYNINSASIAKTDLKIICSPDVEYINSIHVNEAKKELLFGASFNFGNNTPRYTARWLGYKILILPSLLKLWITKDENVIGSIYDNLYSTDFQNNFFTHINKNKLKSTSVYVDSKGRLLSGSLNGLFKLQEDQLVPFDTSALLLHSRITDINELSNNLLVIGTRSNGLVFYKDSIIKIVTITDGLTSDNINCLAIDDNIIWVGTKKGISRITVTSQFPFSYTIDGFTINDGLLSDEINGFAMGKRVIYAATNAGLNILAKDLKSSKNNFLPLYITNVRINEKDTALLPYYCLIHSQNNIDISFTGLSLQKANKISYKYRLTGLDTAWRTTLNRDIQFTGLASGQYEFQLLASIENRIYPEKPVQIQFTVEPTFYETVLFRFSAVFIFILILGGIIQYRIRLIKEKAMEKSAVTKKFSDLNLNALRSQMNPHFTFNVLNSINYYIAKNDADSAQLYISKFSKLIRMILDQSRTEFITLQEEIKLLTLYIELEELRFENKFSYSINVDENLDRETIEMPGMLIQPFVENSIKHGIRFKKGAARVDVHFTSTDSLLICTITDNGIGRDEAARNKSSNEEYKSMGTAIVQERIEALSLVFKGKLKIYTLDYKDELGNPTGTCVKIEIPFKQTAK